MAVFDKILQPLSYLKSNIPGNRMMGTWNILPAVLTTWSDLIQLHNQTADDTYSLYKQQAKEYVAAAKKNAQLIENQGAIALRNMQYKEKLERANDILRVGASNSNLGGTHLDVVMRKEKIRKMNEMALRANYVNQAMMELDNGYRQAAQTYGTMNQNARNVKWGVLNAVLKGVGMYTGLASRDAQSQNRVTAANMIEDNTFNTAAANLDYLYEGTVPVRTNPGTYSIQDAIQKEVPDSISLSSTTDTNLLSPNETFNGKIEFVT